MEWYWSFRNLVADMQQGGRRCWATVSIFHNVSEMRRTNEVGGLRTVGPSTRPGPRRW
jgi:hypothetical protein